MKNIESRGNKNKIRTLKTLNEKIVLHAL